MSQHDMNLANASGAAFRADLNDALVALVGQNSGATAPSTTFAYMLWADTTTGLLNIRNAANSGWITLGTIASAYLGNLRPDVTSALAVGYTATEYNAGTKSTGTFTPDPALGNFQKCVNNGAHTLAPPSSSCTMIIQVTNGASAGAITTSGFTKVTGTAPGTTNGDDFLAFITRVNGFSHLAWQALQ